MSQATTTELTQKNFAEITAKGIVFVDWWAAWCGPCRAFAPVYLAAARRHADVTWGKVDTEAEPVLAATFAIRSIPTLMIFRDGILLFAQPGFLPGPALDELAQRVRALDMDKIRADIAREEAAAAAATR